MIGVLPTGLGPSGVDTPLASLFCSVAAVRREAAFEGGLDAWRREVRRIAPEFYEGLHAYTSWTALLARFVRDPDITLFNAIVRPTKEKAAHVGTRG